MSENPYGDANYLHVDAVYDELQNANKAWLKANGPRANGPMIQAAGREIFRQVVGPYLEELRIERELRKFPNGSAVGNDSAPDYLHNVIHSDEDIDSFSASNPSPTVHTTRGQNAGGASTLSAHTATPVDAGEAGGRTVATPLEKITAELYAETVAQYRRLIEALRSHPCACDWLENVMTNHSTRCMSCNGTGQIFIDDANGYLPCGRCAEGKVQP